MVEFFFFFFVATNSLNTYQGSSNPILSTTVNHAGTTEIGDGRDHGRGHRIYISKQPISDVSKIDNHLRVQNARLPLNISGELPMMKVEVAS